MNSETLIELIRRHDQFSGIRPQASLAEFGAWLAKEAANTPQEDIDLDRMTAYLLGRMNRYARYYARISFTDLPISTIEEFWFLNFAYHRKRETKGAFFDEHVMDKGTGSGILTRLLRAGLLHEARDENDRRIRWVSLTPAGRKVRNQAFAALGEEAALKFTPLSLENRRELLRLLQLLDGFHRGIYKDADSEGIAELRRMHGA
ncbi:MAG: winged helix DNA-binding protein [Bacteroidetes bacterium]|nr:winged helix DNA-binding protein [Bacteroidota bacterium]